MIRRITTGLVLNAVALLILAYSHTFVGSIFFLLLLDSLAAVGLCEFYNIVEKKGSTSLMAFGVIAGVIYCTMSFFTSENPIYRIHPDIFDVTLVAIIIGFFVFQILRRDSSSVIYNLGGTVAGMFYVAWLLAFAAKINYYPFADKIDYYDGKESMGIWFIILLVAIAKGGDAAAYFVGMKFGRHKLCPKISPKKTYEGAVAHFVTGIGAMIVFKYTLFCSMSFMQAFIIGGSLSIVAQFGDIAESLLKRDAELKDSGRHFQEIGGILDLIDSILFSLPLLYYFMGFWLVG